MAAYPKAQYQAARGRPAIGRGGFIALGITLVVVGILSLAFPLFAALSFNLLIGVTLLAGGIVTLAHALRVRRWQGFALQLLLGLLYAGAGVIFIAHPFAGLVALTLTLGAFFVADGVARVLLALQIRPESGWWLFLLSGVLSLFLGLLVLLGLPSGWSVPVLGIVLGINMIFAGIAFLSCTGTVARRRRKVHPARAIR
jgi:uncharacterized membrane protein HdeD (DUF308 family)